MKSVNLRYLLSITLAIVFSLSYVLQANAKSDKEKPFIGVVLQELKDIDKDALNYNGKYGMLVVKVEESSPAEKVGLKHGDILLEIEKREINSIEDVQKILSKKSSGDKLNVKIWNKGKTNKHTIVLAERPQTMAIEIEREMHPNFHDFHGKTRAFLGVETIELKDQLATYFGVENGVLIERIVPESPAEKSGLRSGDVIVAIGDHAITNRNQLIETLASMKADDQVSVGIVRDKQKMQLEAILAEHPNNDFSFAVSGSGMHDFHNLMKEVKVKFHGDELKKDIEALKKELHELKESVAKEIQKLNETKKSE